MCFNVSVVVIADLTIYLDELSILHESSLIAKFKASFSSLGKHVRGVTLLCLGRSRSISALFLCENQSDLKNLEHLYVVGELQSILEELFTSLLRTDDPEVTVHIKNIVWELSDYRRCSLYFSTLTKCEFLQVTILLLHLVYSYACYILTYSAHIRP